jgi:chromate transporter
VTRAENQPLEVARSRALPAFFFVAVSGPLVPWLRRSALAGAFLDGVNSASLALMGVVACQLGWSAVSDLPTAALGAVSALLLFRYRVNSSWLVLGGAGAGLAVQRLGLASLGNRTPFQGG